MAGDGTFNYQMQVLLNTIDDADARARSLKETLDSMDSTARQTLSTWTGAAQDEYNVRQAQWTQLADKMPSTLQVARITLEQIAETYDQAEKGAIDALMAHGGK
jgi:WXG100 family type VII secretion target